MARREHVRIPMTDGISLSATLFFPEAGDAPWPVIMEALPYRKDDAIASYDAHYADLADHGYVSCRLDIRGTGSSGGIAAAEYSADERRDLVEVIDWLATQAWSSGNVGMFGTSYGGFNSLQAALENPPALKAIVPISPVGCLLGPDLIADASIPTLVVGGSIERIVEPVTIRGVYDAAVAPKYYAEIIGADHVRFADVGCGVAVRDPNAERRQSIGDGRLLLI